MNKQIENITQNLISEYHEKQINENKKIVGYICSFMPPEIIDSLGAVPFRIRATGSKSTGKAETYFSPTHCSFVRHTMNNAILGKYEFMESIIFATTCDHARRIYDNWKYIDLKPTKGYLLPIPHVSSKGDIEGYVQDLRNVAEELSKQLNVKFSEDNLKNSIKKYNKQRKLLGEINELRKQQPPPISGNEMMKIYQAISSMLVDDANEILQGILDELKKESNSEKKNPIRIIFGSSHYEDFDQLKTIESENMVVVQDGSCIGTGNFDREVKEEGDPFENLGDRYLTRYSCPKIVDRINERVSIFFDIYEKWGCDGIIIDPLQFCNYWATEGFLYSQEAKKRNIPILKLSHELYSGGHGQLKTRVEAFREQILNSKQ